MKDIREYALANGPAYQHPRRVAFVTDLPWAGTNKLDRTALANFSTISLCGVNGHLAFGVMCAESRLLKANSEPVINTFLPS